MCTCKPHRLFVTQSKLRKLVGITTLNNCCVDQLQGKEMSAANGRWSHIRRSLLVTGRRHQSEPPCSRATPVESNVYIMAPWLQRKRRTVRRCVSS